MTANLDIHDSNKKAKEAYLEKEKRSYDSVMGTVSDLGGIFGQEVIIECPICFE